ncbi:MAG: hypothetical protein P0Y62_14975 [Candidatus Chryseobacterium colombiense]|nr:hypothetical protein [Chryseobacterium sp.]WEK69141.1 MAG: hypothetical protein P0Y62_14975 [Chryseobacterium sp.]
MKQIYFLLVFIIANFKSQVIKDSILGNPKYIKEYVVFLNNSNPYKFMSFDDEYGHAMIMRPTNLRKSMEKSWFETWFCRYINNETYYDRNRNIIKETWYYRSGEIVDDYDYTYDNINRLITEKSINKYSKHSSKYFYEGNNKTAKFSEYSYQWENEPVKIYINPINTGKPLFVSRFDSISKSDSIFTITNEIWKKVDKNSYSKREDTVYHNKLTKVKFYNQQYRVIEEKNFKIDEDFENKKIFLKEHIKYEYDQFGKITKKIYLKDGKFYYYTIFGNGKIIKEEKPDDYGKTSYTTFSYTKDQKLKNKRIYYNDKISNEVRFEYNGNYIVKLFYSDKFGRGDEVAETIVVVFKYKFDKRKNWTEIIKNVNGKDLYKWVREIKYY